MAGGLRRVGHTILIFILIDLKEYLIRFEIVTILNGGNAQVVEKAMHTYVIRTIVFSIGEGSSFRSLSFISSMLNRFNEHRKRVDVIHNYIVFNSYPFKSFVVQLILKTFLLDLFGNIIIN